MTYFVPGTALSSLPTSLHEPTPCIFITTPWGRIRHLSLREAAYLTHRRIVSGWQSKDLHSGLFDPIKCTYLAITHVRERMGQMIDSDKILRRVEPLPAGTSGKAYQRGCH